jgi:hypothetical protein
VPFCVYKEGSILLAIAGTVKFVLMTIAYLCFQHRIECHLSVLSLLRLGRFCGTLSWQSRDRSHKASHTLSPATTQPTTPGRRQLSSAWLQTASSIRRMTTAGRHGCSKNTCRWALFWGDPISNRRTSTYPGIRSGDHSPKRMLWNILRSHFCLIEAVITTCSVCKRNTPTQTTA